MSNKLFFTPGPSALFYTVSDHLRSALRNQIPSISHRSDTFKLIYAEAESNLRLIMDIPSDFHVLFTSSATEVWERLLHNCCELNPLHLVNGEFSGRFYDFAVQMNKYARKIEFAAGQGIDPDWLSSQDDVELLALVHNETSTGAAMQMSDFQKFRDKFPNAIIAVDAVSSAPIPKFDFTTFDSLYFSVQKGFGLPAGLGVWLVNDRCLNKALSFKEKGISIGTFRALPEMIAKSKQNQTVETPNVLGIYLLAKVSRDMLDKGMDMIRRESVYKSAVIQRVVNENPKLSYFVDDPKYRSQTVQVINVDGGNEALLAQLADKGFILGEGYGPYKKQHIRIANFPAHSKEQFDMLSDFISDFK